MRDEIEGIFVSQTQSLVCLKYCYNLQVGVSLFLTIYAKRACAQIIISRKKQILKFKTNNSIAKKFSTETLYSSVFNFALFHSIRGSIILSSGLS